MQRDNGIAYGVICSVNEMMNIGSLRAMRCDGDERIVEQFVIPRLFRRQTDAVARTLRENPRPMFVSRWELDKKSFESAFGFITKDVVDSQALAREKGLSGKIAVAERMMDEVCCKRVSFLGD